MERVVWTYNLIETCLWSAVALFFLVSALRPREKHRLFCLFGTLSFLYFAASEIIEMHTGAWWKPPALLAMKISANLLLLTLLLWWIKIQGSLKNALAILQGQRTPDRG